MAKRENFNDLIGAIQEAFLQVNKLSEMQHLDMLKHYFDEDNNPVCIDVNYPNIAEDGSVVYHKASVPKLCLVPVSSLKLSEVLVDFKVKLYGKIQLKGKERQDDQDMLMSSNALGANKNKEPDAYLGYVSGGFGASRDNDSYANISLKFTSEEPPEGLMRINDEMLKIMI